MAADPMSERLGQLRRLGGDKLIDDLVKLFLETAPRRLGAIREGLAKGDVTSAARAAHSLTSSAGNLGAVELQEVAAELEQAASVGDSGRLPELLTRLEAAWARAGEQLAIHTRGGRP